MTSTDEWEQLPLGAMLAVWDAVPTLVVVTAGPDHTLTYQNPASTRLFGPRTLGRPVAEAFPELSADGYAAMEEVFTTGVAITMPRSTALSMS